MAQIWWIQLKLQIHNRLGEMNVVTTPTVITEMFKTLRTICSWNEIDILKEPPNFFKVRRISLINSKNWLSVQI